MDFDISDVRRILGHEAAERFRVAMERSYALSNVEAAQNLLEIFPAELSEPKDFLDAIPVIVQYYASHTRPRKAVVAWLAEEAKLLSGQALPKKVVAKVKNRRTYSEEAKAKMRENLVKARAVKAQNEGLARNGQTVGV